MRVGKWFVYFFCFLQVSSQGSRTTLCSTRARVYEVGILGTTTRGESAGVALLRYARAVELGHACVGRRQLAIARGPDALDTAAETKEEGGRSQRHEGHQERVFDKILALFIAVKAAEERNHALNSF